MREKIRNGEDGREEPIVKSATEARGGEIILDKRGIWIWIAALVAVVAIAVLAT